MKNILSPSYGRSEADPVAVPAKLPHNTATGCRDRAASDLQHASTSTAGNERKRFERSAETWSQRADMLERVERSFKKRAALDEASREFRRENGPHKHRHSD